MSASAAPRCPTCGSTSVDARNLAVFIDGTSNKPGDEETNVSKLYDAVFDEESTEVKQRKFYLEGIGADDGVHSSLLHRASKGIHRGLEQMFAWSVEKNVMEAYSWLARNYHMGDQIYLFGFSRGAYQVRALAGMIHEVGLVKELRRNQIKQAYRLYRSIDPNDPETRNKATQFKQKFCRPGVRIHFVGVWDTVSSLGLVKEAVHITTSSSVTNACHFRHALALDERRVKFLPEYFKEMNAHHSKIKTPRPVVGDVEEVWFAGCHGDVGGTSRPDAICNEYGPVHAGNVPLIWMRQEAAAKGLVFTPDGFAWNPEDVDLGRKDSMNLAWRLLEYLPILHQVSFSGTGKHKRRLHLSRPRLVIPGQYFHLSVLPGDGHTPRATLADDITIPMVPREGPCGLWEAEPWKSKLLDEGATAQLLNSLLRDERTALKSLGEMLLILDFRLSNRQTQGIPIPEWLDKSIREQSGFEKFTLAVIYGAISNSPGSDSRYSELLESVRGSLKDMLSDRNQLYPPELFHTVRFSARHEKLRPFIAHNEVIDALMVALEQTAKTDATENLFPLVVDSLCSLIRDGGKRDYVVNQLTARQGETGLTRLLLALEVNVPSHLIASLRMTVALALCPEFKATDQLKRRIHKLAEKKRGSVGSAAVEALVALHKSKNVPRNIRFSNILGHLDNALPWIDAEVGSTVAAASSFARRVNDEEVGDASLFENTLSSSHVPQVNELARTSLPTVPLPPVFRTNDSGELEEKDMVMHKLLQAIKSRDAHQRTVATLTLLKLCQNPTVRNFCSTRVMNSFMKQLERKETSLLAAYALNACLKHNEMWTPDGYSRTAKSICTMLKKGWFDGAIGRIEGSAIFRGLMTSDHLRQNVIGNDIVTVLMKTFGSGDRHRVRMSLICLDIILESQDSKSVDLKTLVTESLEYLKKSRRIQSKGVKILSALARTKPGEEAIKPHMITIVNMLLPPDRSPIPRGKLFGPTAALYNLCMNETLRNEVRDSEQFAAFKRRRHDTVIYPKV